MKSIDYDETQIAFASPDERTQYIEALTSGLEESEFRGLNPQQLIALKEALKTASGALCEVMDVLDQQRCKARYYALPVYLFRDNLSDMAEAIGNELRYRKALREYDPEEYRKFYCGYNVIYLG